jgi:hypothetical protein
MSQSKKNGDYLGFHITWYEEWSQFFRNDNWYTFRPILIEFENDKIMGGLEVTVIILGLGVTVRYNHTITDDVSYIRNEIDNADKNGFTGVKTEWEHVEKEWFINGESVDQETYQKYIGPR